MGHSLKAIFARKAGALLLAGSMAGGCAVARPQGVPRVDQAGIGVMVPLTGKVCVALSKVVNPETPVERYVANMYESNRQTVIGRMLFDAEREPSLEVCFDHALNRRNACRFFTVGSMVGSRLLLNPSSDVSDSKRSVTAIHEVRHHFQNNHGLFFAARMNVPPEVRVAAYWLEEADARMAEVLYAWELDRKGESKYKDTLMRNDAYRSAIIAFYAAIKENPDDVAGAARAAVMTWLKNESLKSNYANNTADFIDENMMTLDPKRPVEDLLSVSTFIEIGDIGEYGNYMNLDVISAFTNAFSAEDYAKLDRRRKASKDGRTCSL